MHDFFENPFVSRIVCEYPLPVPDEKFSEDEKMFFDLIDWSSRDFFTSSFYERPEKGIVLSYNITDEGDFYVEKTKIELLKDEKGELELKEKDDGIQKKDFTGEIYFTTEFFGDKKTNLDTNFDYTFTFRALMYKGELKEVDLYEYDKKCNKERKLLQNASAKMFENKLKREESVACKIVHYLFIPFVYAFYIPYNILAWTCHVFAQIVTFVKSTENKIKSKVSK
tara:strand:- start:3427 stop:4101 length:675 start_codon:yes stop_codon:yes gene_type:complete